MEMQNSILSLLKPPGTSADAFRARHGTFFFEKILVLVSARYFMKKKRLLHLSVKRYCCCYN